MRHIIRQTRHILAAHDRFQRIFSLSETKVNNILYPQKPSGIDIKTLPEFLHAIAIRHPELCTLLRAAGEAEQAVHAILAHSAYFRESNKIPRIPLFYNADISLAMLCYALTRYLKPTIAVETGVSYGITAAVILLAMERNNSGRLISIDLPPLLALNGPAIGMAIPNYLAHRWTLVLGNSRYWLPRVVSQVEDIGLFVSDSANVYTLQRHEFATVWPKFSAAGAALINNISARFWAILKEMDMVQTCGIWQQEKPSCVTGLVLKEQLL